MMKDKYYAVSRGIETGIYSTWEECKKQIYGISGAKFKSFFSLKEARKYLNKREAFNQNSFNTITQNESQEIYYLYFHVKCNNDENFIAKIAIKHQSGICIFKSERIRSGDSKMIELQTLFFGLQKAIDLNIKKIEIFCCFYEVINRLKNVQRKYIEKNIESYFITVKDRLAYFSSWDAAHVEENAIEELL